MRTDQEIPVGPDQTLDDVFSEETVSPEGIRRVYHAASLMRSPSQDPDGDLASALKDIKVRLDGLDRLGQSPSGGPPTSLPEQGPSSIPPQNDLRLRLFTTASRP